MRNAIIFCFASLFLWAACSQTGFEKTSDGIIVHVSKNANNPAQSIRLKVVNNEIIRVSAVPGTIFPERKSLVVDQLPGTPAFTINPAGDSIEVVTSKIKAVVSLQSGAVRFADLQGKTLLAEKQGGGKSFQPVSVDNTTGLTFRQVFQSPADEAFYGLGQHQSDEWNYKNKNEILYQYNTKVSVPFLVSNKHYGLFWDNYSLTKFGDARDYSQLSDLKLTDKTGKEGALTATYTTGKGEVFVERSESTIDYENLETVKNFPEKFPFFNASITWEGTMEAPLSGEYKFKLYYAGYTKVFIDNKEVVAERWRTAWNPNTYKFSVNLEAGKAVPVRVEWKPDGGISYIGLKFLSPLPADEQNQMALWSEMGQELDYYFVYGETMDKIISGYRTITGKAPIMPQWAMGFWQSRERYKTQDELVGTYAEFRKRHIPIDNIVMDWFYWEEDQWGSHEFDKTRFSDPKKMLDDVHAMNGHLMISVWPKFYLNTEHYKELDQNGWMYQQAIKDSIRDWVGRGHIGSFYDAYSDGARKLFWKQMNDHLFPLGIDAWWMDASEPDIQSNASMEYRKKLTGPTALGSSTEFFNTYALMNAKAIYEGQREVAPNQRVFLLTRSGFCGLQKYSTATWSGDIGTRWEDLKAQISAGLNFSISGIPYWTMDIGGFCVEHRYEQAKEGSNDLNEWRELNTRWYQFGTFAPLYRAHGQFPYREVFNIAPENHPAYKSILYYNKLRYQLMPYIYSLAGKVHFDDYTIMRPMVMDFAADANVININTQYMFGPALMVCPVYAYKMRQREVYFPQGNGWYDLYSGKFIDGGQQLMVDAPYEVMPMYIKAGSIIPVGPEIEYVGQKPDAPVNLYVYAGGDAEFTLYEDEGVNYNYEKGAYSKIKMIYDEAAKQLTIENREGEFNGMVKDRVFNVIYIAKDKPAALKADQKSTTTVKYNGEKVEIKL